MKATTIKLEGELLQQLEVSKPPDQSLTAYVRAVLRRSLDLARAREAAVEYRAFLESDPHERAWLDEWDRADLNTPPHLEPPVT
jgi:hypothetical protein